MTWWCVTVEGTGFRMNLDGVETRVGFYRNVFLEARDAIVAGSEAVSETMSHEKVVSLQREESCATYATKLAEVASSKVPSKEQGFAFYPSEDSLTAWVIWRLDDNGNKFEVCRVGSEDAAEAIATAYEDRGHKQMYWVNPASADAV